MAWKIFRGTADLSALSPVLSEKSCLHPFIWDRHGPARERCARSNTFVCRAPCSLIAQVIWLGMTTGLSSERKDVCRQMPG